MREFSEHSAWYRFKEGDVEALSFLYEHYVNKLFAYGIKIHPDDSLVKDCIQDVFIQLIDKKQSLQITENTHLYLFKALRNKLFEELRTQNRKTLINQTIQLDANSFEQSAEQSIVLSEEEKYRKELMEKALNALNDYQREAIFLKYSQGFSYDQIAVLLDIEVASARTLIYRILKNVKENISGKIQIFFCLFRSRFT